MKRILFFATRADLQPVLSAIEEQVRIKYVRMTNSHSSEVEQYGSGESISGLGFANRSSTSACHEYLILPRDQLVEIRRLRGPDGTLRYLVDQLSNPSSITFSPGGIWNDDVLLQGRVATVHDHETSQLLIKSFARELRRSFEKVKAYWVGQNAAELLDTGKRLTLSSEASSDFDLRRAP